MALALKYRPLRFNDLIGQDHIRLVLETLLKRYDADEIELPTGLLLTGLRGSGKTTSARIVAAHLNCEGGTEKPCGICPSCKAILNGTSDSVLEIDGATSGLVEDIRNLARIARLSHSGKVRIIIIDEVHAASKEAFSALLKQLEEPPPRVIYILVTTDYQMVPTTIKSRCLKFTFNNISEKNIADRLNHVLDYEGISGGATTNQTIQYIANRSSGSMRDALMMLEQLFILNDFSMATVLKIWPDTLPAFSEQFILTAKANDVKAGMDAVYKAFLSYHDNIVLVDAISTHLKNLAIDILDAGIMTLAGKIKESDILTLMRLTWDLRILLKNSSRTDPILLETLWFVMAKELGGKVLTQHTSNAIVLQTSNKDIDSELVDLMKEL